MLSPDMEEPEFPQALGLVTTTCPSPSDELKGWLDDIPA